MGPATIVPQRSEGAPPVREKLRDVGEAVGERAGAAKERVAEGVGRAGQAVREAVRQVDIEEFNLKGSVGGYPFNVELEDEGEGKFLAFEVNLETENGDVVRISGRKRLGERSVSGEVGSGPSEFRGTDRTEVLGELETRPSDL